MDTLVNMNCPALQEEEERPLPTRGKSNLLSRKGGSEARKRNALKEKKKAGVDRGKKFSKRKRRERSGVIGSGGNNERKESKLQMLGGGGGEKGGEKIQKKEWSVRIQGNYVYIVLKKEVPEPARALGM